MDSISIIQINFFSVGAMLATLFNICVVIFLAQIKNKSKATVDILLIYLAIMFQNIGYIISSTVYHPSAAYHRFITVAAVLPGIIFMVQFFFHFPSPIYPKIKKAVTGILWVISLAINCIFIANAFNADRIFHFAGHYWDFDLDLVSYYISLVILSYIVFAAAAGIWRFIITDDKRRWGVFNVLIAFLIITILPGIANTLSREGAITRETFQIIWNMTTVLGFFILLVIYTNTTTDRISLITKIVGLSLTTFLVMFQAIIYFDSRQLDKYYDLIMHEQSHHVVSNNNYEPPGLMYFFMYDKPAGTLTTLYPKDESIPPVSKTALQNTFMYETIAQQKMFDISSFDALLDTSHPAFLGYRETIRSHIRSSDTADSISTADMLRLIQNISQLAVYHHKTITRLPDKRFSENLLNYLDGVSDEFQPFALALKKQVNHFKGESHTLKLTILEYLEPVLPASVRRYNTHADRHYISTALIDIDLQKAYVFWFDYAYYRQFIKHAALNYLYILLAIFIILLTVYPLFSLRAIVKPIAMLINGVRQIDNKNLDVILPVKAEDEIGILTQSFNNMIVSLKTAHSEINKMHKYLQNIIDSMPSAIISVDADGIITHVNLKAHNATGIDPENAIGRHLNDLLPQMTDQIHRVKKAIAEMEFQKSERIAYQKNGELHYMDILVYPLITNGMSGAVLRVDNVTERVQIEQMMIQTEKMVSLGGLAAGMAHEINNPLSGILMSAENVLRRVSADLPANIKAAEECGIHFPAIHAYMEKRNILAMLQGIREMGQRSSQIVADMLNFSRKSSQMVSSNVSQIVDRAIHLAQHDYDLKRKYDFRHIAIIKEFRNPEIEILCHPNEIEQVLLNLLRNAAQAATIKKETNPSYQPVITVRIFKENNSVHIEVEDNGSGIEEKIINRIFEPFFTTKEVGTGTGLGLSVSYFIISNNHQGTMFVRSTINTGSCFTITLPLEQQEAGRENT